jgi:hypothetical protein
MRVRDNEMAWVHSPELLQETPGLVGYLVSDDVSVATVLASTDTDCSDDASDASAVSADVAVLEPEFWASLLELERAGGNVVRAWRYYVTREYDYDDSETVQRIADEEIPVSGPPFRFLIRDLDGVPLRPI